MALAPGARLGPYEILAPLGAGGMGEVYRARDTRLDRTVAIKVLPEHLAASPEAKARFEREARAVSALNHPHICTLHDVGREGAVDFLVMEHLEGETLQSRLERGPLPLEGLLELAVQIADALSAAHRQGVLHRDLKPGNVMLTKAGVKLLDFGLAKGLGTGSASDRTASPTMTSPLTAAGTIVGTFQYMAPEQLEGKEADARTDVFAFGAVLHEMATGRRAFEGKTQVSVIAAILKEEPRPISTLQPAGLARLAASCLEKDPEERRQSMHDVLLDLQWIASGGAEASAPSRPRRRERAWMVAAAVLALVAAALGAAVVRLSRGRAPAEPIRFAIGVTEEVTWRPWNSMAISPDGRRIVFFAQGLDGAARFWLRALDAMEFKPLPGTDVGNASFPFWSPDGRSVGFFAGGKLKRIEVAGGPPQARCDAPDGRGGTWSRDGTIVFSPGPGSGLLRVPASGANPRR